MERERERELAGDLSSSVPVIDISRLGKDPAVAKQIVEAAEWPGFFHITGHGIDEVIGPLRETSAYLFTKTSKEALESAKRDPQNSRGYFDDVRTTSWAGCRRCELCCSSCRASAPCHVFLTCWQSEPFVPPPLCRSSQSRSATGSAAST